MEDANYQVLAELYFVTSYEELRTALAMDDDILLKCLSELLEKGWIRCYHGVDNELIGDEVDLPNSYRKYHYLASKEGLFAHNSV